MLLVYTSFGLGHCQVGDPGVRQSYTSYIQSGSSAHGIRQIRTGEEFPVLVLEERGFKGEREGFQKPHSYPKPKIRTSPTSSCISRGPLTGNL